MLPLPSPQSKPQNPAAAPRFPRQVPEAACPGGGAPFPLRAHGGARSRAEPRRAVPALPPRGAQLPPAGLGAPGRGPGGPVPLGSLARPLRARARSRKAAEGRLQGSGRERGGGAVHLPRPPGGRSGGGARAPAVPLCSSRCRRLPRPEAGMRQAGLPAAPRRARRVGVLLAAVRGPAPEVCASGCLQPLPR